MPFFRSILSVLAVVAVCAAGVPADAQPPRFPLDLEPEGSSGEAVWPAYEGWSRNPDGSLTLLIGYFNRNEGVVDVPIGDDNRMGPMAVDMGQPTHFLPGRNWGVFSVTVPADQAEQELTWALRVNNQLAEITFWANPPYFTEPFLNHANGNTPPLITVGANGDALQGPPHGVAASYTTTVDEPLTLVLGATDQPLANAPERRAGRRRSPLSVTWRKYRGPGDVTFAAEEIDSGASLTHSFDELTGGETMTTVTFSEPGEYRLMATGNDTSGNGGGGDQCCWTTAHVDVTVNP